MDRDGAEALSAELASWVERRAETLDRPPETVLERAVAAHRLAVDADLVDGDPDGLADPERLDDLADRLDETDDRVDEAIGDLRERVIEVLETAEERAPRDHDHPELAATGEVTELRDELDRLAVDLVDLEDRVDDGFDNYETVLEALNDRTDGLADRTDSLAAAVTDLRSQLRDIDAAAARRKAVDELRRAANRQGVREADCESCGTPLDVALLTAPQCPHCGGTFDDVDPGAGFFATPTLSVGNRPALTDSPGNERLSETADVDSGDGRTETTEATDGGDPMSSREDR